MIYNPKTYTVESVTSGHPDKMCDRISDAILDECLRQDPKSRVAVETFGGHKLLVVCGEVTTTAKVPYEAIARRTYTETGYADDLRVIVNIVEQSPDIAQGVDTGGAGDQGIMYGYASNETPEFMPKYVVAVHALAKRLEELRTNGTLPWLRPDGKTQITVKDGQVNAVLVSTQHDEKMGAEEIRTEVIKNIITPIMGPSTSSGQAIPFEILVNPTGSFILGGFTADTGLTGRKIMVDTYCGLAPHGGGCFSGKDATKVDRSAAYMARFAAKNLVANGFAKECLVSVAYAIGRVEPLMVEAINETGESIGELARKHFDFRPLSIIERLNLRRPIYKQTAAYGHFGKAGLPWEEVVKL
jgi:S-adenosylmethionine synthetase